MKETDWFDLDKSPVHPGVYKTMHLTTARIRITGYSKWSDRGWGYTENSPEQAAMCRTISGVQSKQWKGLTSEKKWTDE